MIFKFNNITELSLTVKKIFSFLFSRFSIFFKREKLPQQKRKNYKINMLNKNKVEYCIGNSYLILFLFFFSIRFLHIKKENRKFFFIITLKKKKINRKCFNFWDFFPL